MFAAISATRNGAKVLLIDKNVVGRGGATIMAQMTCASALGEEELDSPDQHLMTRWRLVGDYAMKIFPPFYVKIVQIVSVNSKIGKSNGFARKMAKYARSLLPGIAVSDVFMLIF